jgi:hypothetical protein
MERAGWILASIGLISVVAALAIQFTASYLLAH